MLAFTLSGLRLTQANTMNDYFPVACADRLSRIGLLVKARRLSQGLRQADLTQAIGVSPHTLRKIESGSERVDLRSFMLVLWRLGLTEVAFNTLDGIEHSSEIARFTQDEDAHASLASRRVRLSKPKPGDF